MSEQETPEEVETEAQEAEETTAEEAKEPFDQERALAKIRKANQEAEGLRKRLKDLEPLAAKAKELEDANKSDNEKLTERLTSAEKAAASASAELLRLRVGLRKGLTEKQAKRLVGETEEDLEADADDLLDSFAAKKDPETPKVPTKPKERLRGGGEPNEEPEETDPRKLAAGIRRNR